MRHAHITIEPEYSNFSIKNRSSEIYVLRNIYRQIYQTCGNKLLIKYWPFSCLFCTEISRPGYKHGPDIKLFFPGRTSMSITGLFCINIQYYRESRDYHQV